LSFNYNLATRALSPTVPGAGTNARNAIGRDPAALLLTVLGRAETLRSLGGDTLDGKAVRVASFADADGTVLTLSFDATNGLLSRTETLAANPVEGDLLTETLFSDYRDVAVGTARAKLPFRVITRAGGDVVSDFKFTTVAANAGLAPEVRSVRGDARPGPRTSRDHGGPQSGACGATGSRLRNAQARPARLGPTIPMSEQGGGCWI
jgi:hypothetical protein